MNQLRKTRPDPHRGHFRRTPRQSISHNDAGSPAGGGPVVIGRGYRRPVECLPQRRRLAALGGVVGPAAFLAAWALLGRRGAGYSPADDAISRLAATGAPDRYVMTAGLVALGTGLPLYGSALRATLSGPAWLCATATGLATLGVASFPLGSPTPDRIHGVLAGIGYATLAATPLAAAAPLARSGRTGWARLSAVAGLVSGASLLATVAGPGSGLFQRLGLTAGHAWVVASAVDILRTTGRGAPGAGRRSGARRP